MDFLFSLLFPLYGIAWVVLLFAIPVIALRIIWIIVRWLVQKGKILIRVADDPSAIRHLLRAKQDLTAESTPRSVAALEQRIALLEERLARIEQQLSQTGKVEVSAQPPLEAPTPGAAHSDTIAAQGASPAPTPHSTHPVEPPVPLPPTSDAGADHPPAPSPSQRLLQWLAEDWLMKVGGVFLILGIGWFLAATYQYIPLEARIALGLLAGAGAMAGGWWRLRSVLIQGEILMGIGSAIVLLTLAFARFAEALFTPLSALSVMALTVATVALASLRSGRSLLLLWAVELGAIAPFLTNSPFYSPSTLFLYLLALSAGSLWLAAIRGWHEVSFAAILVAILYSLFAMAMGIPEEERALLLILSSLLGGAFFLSHTLARTPSRWRQVLNLAMALLNGIFLASWVWHLADPPLQTMLFLAWALVFSVGGTLLSHIRNELEPFLLYLANAFAFTLAAGTSLLEGPTLALFYLVAAALLPIIAYTVTGAPLIAAKATVAMGLPLLAGAPYLTSWRWEEEPAASFLVLSSTAVALGGLALFLRHIAPQEKKPDGVSYLRRAQLILSFLASFYLLVVLWQTPFLYLGNEWGVAVSMVLYTILGSAAYLGGTLLASRPVRWWGIGVLLFVIVHLIVVEAWVMPRYARIATFVAVGLLLIGSPMLDRTLRQRFVHHKDRSSV